MALFLPIFLSCPASEIGEIVRAGLHSLGIHEKAPAQAGDAVPSPCQLQLSGAFFLLEGLFFGAFWFAVSISRNVSSDMTPALWKSLAVSNKTCSNLLLRFIMLS